jgi:signal transduction histidine kinase
MSFLSTLLWDFVQLDITLVLVWVGIQLGLRPVRKLRDEIAQRSPQDLRPIAESSVPREIAPLAATLNRLFFDAEDLVQSQQQFIANTAHQLRTPITGMQAQLDLLVAEPAAAADQTAPADAAGRRTPAGAFGESAAEPGARRPGREHRGQESTSGACTRSPARSSRASSIGRCRATSTSAPICSRPTCVPIPRCSTIC